MALLSRGCALGWCVDGCTDDVRREMEGREGVERVGN